VTGPEHITSTANPRIKALAQLKQRSSREASGRFLIEGHREVERAHAAGVTIHEIVLAPDLCADRERVLADRLAQDGIPNLVVGSTAYAKVSMRRHPDGLLAVAEWAVPGIDELWCTADSLALVVDGVEKPGNLGGILRTADGAGVDAVVVTSSSVDPTNPNVIRASQGAVFSVQLAITTAAAAREWLERRGLRIVTASPEGTAPIWDADLTGGVAVVVGGEAEGVGPAFRTAGDLVAIPMAGAADSLNASVAAGIMLYEAVRQRRRAS
jgi:TrmH family RNA methyltransferase